MAILLAVIVYSRLPLTICCVLFSVYWAMRRGGRKDLAYSLQRQADASGEGESLLSFSVWNCGSSPITREDFPSGSPIELCFDAGSHILQVFHQANVEM